MYSNNTVKKYRPIIESPPNRCSFSINSSRKKKIQSSDEQTNEQDLESRKQMSLKLFQGIKQLQEPIPYLQNQSTSTFQTILSLSNFKLTDKNRQLIHLNDVKDIIKNVVESCFMEMRSQIEIQSRYILRLENKISSLQNLIDSLPKQLKKIHHQQHKRQVENNLLYEKEIQQLNLKMIQLEKQLIQSQKIIPPKYQTPLNLTHNSKIQQTTELYITPLSQFNTDQDEKSLLQGIEEDLAYSQLKQNSKQYNKNNFLTPIIYSTYSEKIVHEPVTEISECTIKKRHHSMNIESPLKNIQQTTRKKPKIIPDSDQRLMSFAKNPQIVIVEEQMSSQQSDEVHQTDQKYEKLVNRSPKKLHIQKNPNPKKSLNFSSPSSLDHNYNQPHHLSYEQSDVEQFSIHDSSKMIKRLSLSKRKVPSLIEQIQNPNELLLFSKEEKYLLGEIKQLRKIVQWDEELIVQQSLWTGGNQQQYQKSNIKKKSTIDTRRKIMKQYEMTVEELKKTEIRQKRRLQLLTRTKNELTELKHSLYALIPCQYCEFQHHLRECLN